MLHTCLKRGCQWLLVLSLVSFALPLRAAGLRADGVEFFEARIRPVLVERCYKCHSAEAEKLKGSLRLDSREGVLKGGESGKPAVVPRDVEKSRLIEAIRYRNDELQMPPTKAGGKLREDQIADFVAWVEAGAPDPRTANPADRPASVAARSHWAFKPPRTPAVPTVKETRWPKTSVDFFILSKLETKGLQPSPPADKRTLIRRASFDLTGLPPRPEEVDAFLADKSGDAFARVVDGLLSSPRYGERWGRYWLDVARYSDTKGYVYTDREEGRFVQSHAYRDWVIAAFNGDMPYDRFLRLQIAADRIAPAGDPSDLAAAGFLTLGRRFLGVVHDIIDDRIDVVMRGTQGLTVGCARCHDHKFDPIPTRDYYSLYGVFNGSTERVLPLTRDLGRDGRYTEFLEGLREREEKLQTTFRRKCEELSDRLRSQSVQYLTAVLEVDKLPSEEFYAIRGPDDLNPTIVRQWDVYLRQTGRSAHPVFALWHAFEKLPANDFRARAIETIRSFEGESTFDPPAREPRESEGTGPALRQPLRNPEFTARETPAKAGGPPARLAAGTGINRLVLQAFATNPPSSMRDVAARYGELLMRAHQAWRDLVKRAEDEKAPSPLSLPDADQEALRGVLYAAGSPVLVPTGAIVDLEWFFDEGGRVELAKLQAEIDRWIIKSPSPPYAVILEDRPTQRNPRVFIRGNPANKGEEVPRQFPEILAGEGRRPFSDGSGRLELANAIASKTNPLTARVMVNRIWQHHFGTGLVRTPSDFGTRCDPPSHPELLDWLACRFMADGWSIKRLHRLIMLSAVYQQSSEAEPPSGQSTARRSGLSTSRSRAAARFRDIPGSELDTAQSPPSPRTSPPGEGALAGGVPPAASFAGKLQPVETALRIDPENRLLWHFNRQRLDFESARDSLLAVSAELDVCAGGKPVELFKRPFAVRRTVYGFIDRQFLPGVFRVFDFANPDMHSPQRLDTTVPQQALFFMNSPFVIERARALAGRADVVAIKSPERRIDQLYRIVFQRPSSSAQIELGRRFVAEAGSLPAAELPKPVVSPWQYGFGAYDESSQRVTRFEPLPHFTGEAWQGGEGWPDPRLGWVQLTAQGGHAGNDLQHAAIRRWVAPRDAVVSVSGTLQHSHKEGDGIRGSIVHNRAGRLGNWTLHNDKAETKLARLEVKKDDTLDFLVDFNADLNSDDFQWSPVITSLDAPGGGSSVETTTEWSAKKDFAGPSDPPPRPLSPWERYAQVLLLSNEFMFVD